MSKRKSLYHELLGLFLFLNTLITRLGLKLKISMIALSAAAKCMLSWLIQKSKVLIWC